MITINHARATLTVKPEHAQATYDLLALIDKTKGKRGAKLARPKAIRREHNSGLRSYPEFYSGMSTREYLRQYAVLNAHVHLLPASDAFDHDRPAPMLDPSTPEVVEELCEQ